MSAMSQTIYFRKDQDKQIIYNLICDKHPGKNPIVFIKRDTKSKTVLSEIKFIVAPETTLMYLASQIRTQMNLQNDLSLYFYTMTGKILKQDSMILEIYNDYKDPSGFLFLEFSEVECLG